MMKTEQYVNHATVTSGIPLWFGRVVLFLFLSGVMTSCERFDCFSRSCVATVNGEKIYLDEYQACLDRKKHMMPEEFLKQPDHRKAFEEEVLDGMIREKIMYQRARELNISVSNDELENKIREIREDYGGDFPGLFTVGKINYETWKEEFKKEIVLQKLVATDVNARIKISEGEIEDYFHQHRNEYKRDLRARVWQIVVSNRETAEKALARLKSGEDFAKVAAEVSISPEARRGGDLGFITRWIMPEPLDKTIFSLPVNTISPIVQSPYGFHILKVTDIQRAKEATLADVKEEVAADIRLRKEEAAYMEWMDALEKKAVVKKETGIEPSKSER